jgi:hypothetical protein
MEDTDTKCEDEGYEWPYTEDGDFYEHPESEYYYNDCTNEGYFYGNSFYLSDEYSDGTPYPFFYQG